VAVAQRKEARRAQLEAQYAQRTGMPGHRGPVAGMQGQPGMQQQARARGYSMNASNDATWSTTWPHAPLPWARQLPCASVRRHVADTRAAAAEVRRGKGPCAAAAAAAGRGLRRPLNCQVVT
jgi:hypothetical protein